MVSWDQGRAVAHSLAVIGGLTLALLPLAGCAGGATATTTGGKIQVVAAENFWGSIAAQLGKSHVTVTSIIANPATDPHDYEPTAQDARVFAGAQYVIINGAGYDTWAQQALDANPNGTRVVLDVAKLAGRKAGDNPHMWYNPAIVGKVADRITADLKRLDGANAVNFDLWNISFENTALGQYHDLLVFTDAHYSGTPVGATESIFEELAPWTGLNLITPPSLMKAIAEGQDLTAGDKATMSQQIDQHQIKVLVFNSQNTTNDVSGVVSQARAVGIPVVAMTETLSPAGASFQDWQVAQLKALDVALAQATGK